MPRPMTVTDTLLVSAPPDAVHALVADPTRTAEWSPENRGARTTGAGPLPVGAVSTGRNERFGARWTDGGTRVTQTWTDDRRWPDPVAAVVDRVLTRSSFAAFQRRNLATSLARLRQVAQA